MNEDAHLIVRRARVSDLPSIASIWLEGQAEASSVSTLSSKEVEDFYRPWASDSTSAFGIWVAERQQREKTVIAGWQSLLPCRARPFHEKLWAQSSTYIATANRGQGVGRVLLTYATRVASDLGLSHVMGYIKSENVASIHLVESLGWRKAGEVPGYSEEGHLEIFFYVVDEVGPVADIL